MILTKTGLIPASLRAAVSSPAPQNDREWSEQLRERMAGREQAAESDPPPPRYWNWTDTRGDRFAICVAKDEISAKQFVIQHAFVHLCEIDKQERENAGYRMPASRAGLEEYYRRLKGRALGHCKDCILREITREEFETLVLEQGRRNRKELT